MDSLAVIIAFLLPFERLGALAFGGANVRPSQLAFVAGLIGTFVLITRAEARIRLAEIFRYRETLALLAFLAWCAVTLLNAENPHRSFVVLAFTVFTASLAIWLPFALRNVVIFLRVRSAILVSSALVGVFGLWQFLGDMLGLPIWLTGLRPQYTKAILGFTRVQSTALEPLYFADYLLLPIALAVTWLLTNPERKIARRLWALLALLTLNFVLTASRGGYVAAVVMVIIIAWMHRHRLPAIRKLLASALIGGVIVFAALRLLAGFAVTTPGSLTDVFVKHVVTVTDGAAYIERLETFGYGFDAFAKHPWTGVGIGGYGPFVATHPHVEPANGWAIVNNEPIELLAETGLIGLLLFVAFLFAAFVAAFKNPKHGELDPIRIAAIAALVGMLVQYQTFSTLYLMHVWFTIGLMLASARIPRNT